MFRQITREELLSYDVFICDLDGVIFKGGRLISENVKALLEIQGLGKKIRFLTNNSTKKPSEYVGILRSLGFEVHESDVITSGLVTAVYLRKRGVKRVYVIGSPSLRELMRIHGLKTVFRRVEAVVVGLDINLNYSKIKRASSLIHSGALFVATNTDPYFPTSDGVIPGAGSLVAAISTACSKDPDVVLGKPNPLMFRVALEGYEGLRVLVIGDRLDTDIRGSSSVGLDSLLVLTGVHSLRDVDRLGIKPTFWSTDLMLPLLSNA